MLGMIKLFIILYASIMFSKCDNIRQRVYGGRDALKGEFPYVVSLQKTSEFYRMCTGTLISNTCVLTASHCIKPTLELVRFGNMTITRNATNNFRKVLKMLKHPNFVHIEHGYDFHEMRNDIALVFIQSLIMDTYAKISGIDYKALMGKPVVYAGFGRTYDGETSTFERLTSLQVGEGVVTPCLDISSVWEPSLCVAPKCSSNMADAAPGDSGGPVFFRNKVVAVIGGGPRPVGIYTPVSLYFDWIRSSMIAESQKDFPKMKKNKNFH